jgi:hypothetical protein
MRPAKKIESNHTAVIIDFKTRKIRQHQANSAQSENEEKACFRSNHSYYCQDTACDRWSECQKLVAVWVR